MITIKDIARESGYSTGTVSRALNGGEGVSAKAMERIMKVVKKYNFSLNANAKLLKQQESHGIAVIHKGTENMLFAAITELIQHRVESSGFECTMFYLDEDENEVQFAHRMIRERKPKGILFMGCNIEYFRIGFEGIKIPCVLVTNDGSGLGFRNLSSVSTDDRKAAEIIIDKLIDEGHTKIGIVGGDTALSTASANRYEGCMNSFKKHGIQFDPAVQYEAGHYTLESGYECTGRLFRKMPDMTALFAMSDVTAIGAMRAAADRGISIPDDLSLIGFDGIDIADYVNPRLTTVRQNREELAARSLDILLGMIRGDHGGVHELLPFSIKNGDSVRRIHADKK